VKRKILTAVLVISLVMLPVSFFLLGMSIDSAYSLNLDSVFFQGWWDIHNSLPEVDTESGVVPSSSYFSLLDHMYYVPEERDQGVNGTFPHCGNCWVWPGTGIMEIALNVQCGIKDRLSIQYITSCMNYSDIHDPPDWLQSSWWPCCGGSIQWFTDFYSDKGYVIPWSNTNAHWQDGGVQCSAGSSTVSCDTISTTPNYTVTECALQKITTHGMDKETAISNIKDVLHQNRGVYFSYFFCEDNWPGFIDFWYNQPETAIWTPPSSPLTCTPGNCAVGHAVLCVGYNDTDPENSYWIMLNSWGTAHGERPNGLFRMNMDIDYTSTITDECADPPEKYPSLWWETIDATFETIHDVAITSSEPYRTILGNNTSTAINVTAENQGDYPENFNVTIYYNLTIIEIQTVDSGNSTTLMFNWNTTGIPLGNYTLTAVASQVPGETEIEDNALTFYPIQISIAGDINADGTVNIVDISKAAVAFQTNPGDPSWNSNADVNEDTVINIIDISKIAIEYGKTT
jgi:hypothetical protein